MLLDDDPHVQSRTDSVLFLWRLGNGAGRKVAQNRMRVDLTDALQLLNIAIVTLLRLAQSEISFSDGATVCSMWRVRAGYHRSHIGCWRCQTPRMSRSKGRPLRSHRDDYLYRNATAWVQNTLILSLQLSCASSGMRTDTINRFKNGASGKEERRISRSD